MSKHLFLSVGILMVAALLVVAGCQRSAPVAAPLVADPSVVELSGVTYKISGPYTHENLNVFLLHAPDQDDNDYITLDQGLKEGVVKVTEKEGGGQVSELMIENKSEHALFLQEGDRLSGGKQDRTLYTSIIIPPKSGVQPIPTYCIEAGRWTEGQQGVAFESTSNTALAPKEVRQAAKISKDQSRVWHEVADQKARLASNPALMAPNTNSSLNEALDSEAAKKVSDAFAKALQGVLADKPDAVGVAIVVNGEVEEVNIYPNHKLLNKLYPRLVQSYAFMAFVEKEKAKEAKPCSVADVNRFMTESKNAKEHPAEQINAGNRLYICTDEAKAKCVTEYEGKAAHVQFLKGSPAQAGQSEGGQAPNRAPQQSERPNAPGQQPSAPPQPPAPSKP